MFLEIPFNHNESLKELLVSEYGVVLAKTTYFEAHPLYGVPFYETECRWDLPYTNPIVEGLVDGALQEVLKVQDSFLIHKIAYMDDPLLEMFKSCPVLLWAIAAYK